MDAKVQATGRGKSAVVQDALELYFGAVVEAPKQMIVETSAKVEKARAREPERARAKEEPKVDKPRPCNMCGSATIFWGSGRRCGNCLRNWEL
jgi:hypothetical protein